MLLDTAITAPEDIKTLKFQQNQLISGKRTVQMFPNGTEELPLPAKMEKCQNLRGVFHYNPKKITSEEILKLSRVGRENEFLLLGPFCKPEIVNRILSGEKFVPITEYSEEGVEIRSAAGTDKTIEAQLCYFERTKEPTSRIVVGTVPDRIAHLMKG
jgi:hypothetical protein